MLNPNISKKLSDEQLEFYQLALDGAEFEMNARINEIKQELKAKELVIEEKDQIIEEKNLVIKETKTKLDAFVKTVMELLHCSYDEAIKYVSKN